jgi:hypothetical protein
VQKAMYRFIIEYTFIRHYLLKLTHIILSWSLAHMTWNILYKKLILLYYSCVSNHTNMRRWNVELMLENIQCHLRRKKINKKNFWISGMCGRGDPQISWKIYKPLKNSTLQNSDMNKLPYWEPTNNRRHRTEFSLSDDLAPGICTPLT